MPHLRLLQPCLPGAGRDHVLGFHILITTKIKNTGKSTLFVNFPVISNCPLKMQSMQLIQPLQAQVGLDSAAFVVLFDNHLLWNDFFQFFAVADDTNQLVTVGQLVQHHECIV